MKKKVLSHFATLEAKRHDFFELVAASSDTQLQFKSDPEAWSILQVAGHLINSERLSLEYMRKKTAHPEKNKNAGWRGWLAHGLLSAGLSVPFRYKAPVKAILPSDAPSRQQTLEEWDEIRKGMKDLFEQLPEEAFEKEFFKHPLAGKMNAFHGVDFFTMHFDHHMKQVDRIRNHPDFPS